MAVKTSTVRSPVRIQRVLIWVEGQLHVQLPMQGLGYRGCQWWQHLAGGKIVVRVARYGGADSSSEESGEDSGGADLDGGPAAIGAVNENLRELQDRTVEQVDSSRCLRFRDEAIWRWGCRRVELQVKQQRRGCSGAATGEQR